MKRHISIFLLLLLIIVCSVTNQAHAQDMRFFWQKVYEDFEAFRIGIMIPTSDNGFILSGTLIETDNNIDCWVMKFNHLGSIEWYNTFGSSIYNEFPYSCIQLSDKGYIIAGVQRNNKDNSSKAWIIKTNSRGILLWEKIYPQDGTGAVYALCETQTGGFAIAGKLFVNEKLKDDAWILECNNNGDVIWETTYGGINNDVIYSIVNSPEGYTACGKRVVDVQRDADFWILKLNVNGEFEWDRTFGSTGDDTALEIFMMKDLGFTFWGHMINKRTNKIDTWVVKLSSEGYIEWEKTIGGFGVEIASSIFHTADDGFMISGESIFSNDFNSNFWILKLDNNGDIEFDNEFVGPGRKNLGLLIQVKDGSYVLSGFEQPQTSYKKNLFLFKFRHRMNSEDSLYAQIADYVTSDYVGGMFLPLRRERLKHFEPIIYISDRNKLVLNKEEPDPITSIFKNKYYEQTFQFQVQTQTKSIKDFNQPGVYREIPVIRYYGRYGALFSGMASRYIDKYVNDYTVRLLPRYIPRYTYPYAEYKEIYEAYPKGEEEVPTDYLSKDFGWKQKSAFSSKALYNPGSSKPQENPRKQKVSFRLAEYTLSTSMLIPMIFLWLLILAAIVVKILFSMRK